ncbi:MAG TPA: response regulator [Polyangiales bacterium]|nr:response regulator [Polyangiales bacterium]
MQLVESRNVLVVEDERVVAKDLQRTLTNLGYEVPVTVATADDAIRAAAERCPDLVLMDIRIKGARDGIETAEILKSRFDVPVVYLTAYADQQTVSRAKLTEPHAYLLKPVKVDELRTAVEIAIYKHEMERRQRERERWFATTLRSIGDAVISTDAEGCITLMNPMAETMTGWRTADVRGKRLSDILKLVDESTSEAVEDPVAQVLRAGKVLHVRGALVARTGHEHIIADSAAPIFDEAGKLLGVVVVFRDVSESRRLQRRLEFAERLASLGTLAAGVAHEINNPLSFVVANVDFALNELKRAQPQLRGLPWLDEVVRALGEAQVGAGRVSQIVSELRAFARPANVPFGRVDVNRVLASALDMAASELRSVRLSTDYAELPPVIANETRLSQVFFNLLINAAQAIAAKGGQGDVHVSSRVFEAGQVVVEIRDTGTGISSEIRKRIFDPFFTTKAPGSGTGLGLAVCHGIVTSLGGEIDLQSQVGEGTTFRVLLPAAPPEMVAPPPPVPEPTGSLPARVLVVDDEPMVRNTLARMLSKEYTISVASDAQEALTMISRGERFDLILSDVSMAGMSGMDLHDALAQRHADQAQRMVFLSGGAFTGESIDFLRQMAHRHLEKPFALSQLRELIRDQLDKLGRCGREASN